MKKIIIICILAFINSCSKENTTTEITPKNETDKVILKDNKEGSFTRFSKAGYPLIEKIYYKLIENDPHLKKLDKAINQLNNENVDYNRNLNSILQKPEDYYSDAKNRTIHLRDSLLKREITELIELSEKEFRSNTSSLNEKIKNTTLNYFTINDLYNVLKIKKTLPAIEKFQKTIPDNQKIDSIIKEQEKLIKELKSLKK